MLATQPNLLPGVDHYPLTEYCQVLRFAFKPHQEHVPSLHGTDVVEPLKARLGIQHLLEPAAGWLPTVALLVDDITAKVKGHSHNEPSAIKSCGWVPALVPKWSPNAGIGSGNDAVRCQLWPACA